MWLLHAIGLGGLVDAIVAALHHAGVHHLNVDRSGAHHAWVESRHWLITIRWKP